MRSTRVRTSRLAAASLAAALLAALPAPGVPSPLGAQEAAPDGPRVALWEPPPARGQPFELTIRNIMRGPELVGTEPEDVRWADDGSRVYFRWRPGGTPWHEDDGLWRVDASGGEPERIPDEAADSVAGLLYGGDVSPDRTRRVTAWRGDLWLVDRTDGTPTRLTRTRRTEGSPVFSADGREVYYRVDSDLFALDLEGGGIRQLTDIRSGAEPAEDDTATGHRRFLEEQQAELFEHVWREREEEAEREARDDAREEAEPKPVWMGPGRQVASLSPSPEGEHVLVTAFSPPQDARTVGVPDWVTESGFTEDLRTRPKVGDAVPEARVGLLHVESGAVEWLEPVEDTALDVRTVGLGWNDGGSHALLFTASDDDERAWLHSVRASDGEVTLLDARRDEAWESTAWSRFPRGGWIPGTARAWFVSEESGFAHLYTVEADGSDRRQLTDGGWEVLDVEIPESRDHFLLETSEGSPFDRVVYRMDFDGSDKRAVLDGTGSWAVTPSPDGATLAVVHSRADTPPELYLAPADNPDALARVTVSPTEAWRAFPWIEPEIVRFEARDGVLVPARIYRPSDVGAEPNGAGVIFVHGAGYLHNVHNWWSSYYREYMFNHFLAASGYTVLDIDYRGSAGYGRDWRTAIYRHMGGQDLTDQVDGARWLVEAQGVDPERIGIYGGSYGGFITLMALFTAGDTFKAGAALRSVTDWAHYNDNYTSAILNDPQEDEEAYRRSSPIYFAEGLGTDQHLLMLHGMVDVNVHFSDVVRLSQRLIELGKENWELAVYPVEGHGFVEPSSWTDEYRRVFELFERTISRPGCTEGGELCPVPHGTAEGTAAPDPSG